MFPKITFKETPGPVYDLDTVLNKLNITSNLIPVYKDLIDNHPESETIINLLGELTELIGCKVGRESSTKIVQISKHLKIINSPLNVNIHNNIPYDQIPFYYDYWNLDKIKSVYRECLINLNQDYKFHDKKKFLKLEVAHILQFLIDQEVILDYRLKDLFVNSIKGELYSYFRDYKIIQVKVI